MNPVSVTCNRHHCVTTVSYVLGTQSMQIQPRDKYWSGWACLTWCGGLPALSDTTGRRDALFCYTQNENIMHITGTARGYITRYSAASHSSRAASQLATPTARRNENAGQSAASSFDNPGTKRRTLLYHKILNSRINYAERVYKKDSTLASEFTRFYN